MVLFTVTLFRTYVCIRICRSFLSLTLFVDSTADCLLLQKQQKNPKKIRQIETFFFADDVDSRKAENLLEVMEQIDDDCAKRGIHFVKVSEDGAAEQFGVARLPSLVFFKNDLPSLYEGM